MTLFLVLAAAVFALPAAALAQNTPRPVMDKRPIFYVAVSGNDAWSGKIAAPNKARTDGPFRTLARAQKAVRPEIQTERAAHTVTVQVRGGTHYLSAPLVFDKADSGTNVTPVLWEAYPGETPIISGGQAITNFTQTAPNRWEAVVPDVKAGAWYFESLYVGEARKMRPRLPKTGYHFIAGDLPPTEENAKRGFDRFRFAPGDLNPNWHNLSDVQILTFQIWTMARLPVKSVDAQENTVTFGGHTANTEWYSRLPRGNRYLVENVREALSEPGEWYLDRKTGVLTYLARPGENPNKAGTIAPRLSSLVEINGAERITFRGLTFSHAAYLTPPTGNTFVQAEINVPAAVRLFRAREISFDACTISHISNYGISFEDQTQNCAFINGKIADMGGGGVKIGETKLNDGEDAIRTGHIRVENNVIAHGGRIHPASIGVWIGHSAFNTVSHNEIADFYYTGISPGWSWGYGKSGAHDNQITYNRIHHIGQGVLSDMGGIYTLGVSTGTRLDHNVISDISAFDYGGWGIYFDEGTTDIIAENNIAYRTKSAPFHQHYGKNNLVKNNIFAYGNEAQLMRTRAEDHLSFTLENNIVLWNGFAPLLGSNWSGTPGSNFVLQSNLYWNPTGADKVRFGDNTLAQWQAKGADKNSVIADPLFVSPETGDFRLKANSSALQIGFVPIDIKTVGVRGKFGLEPVALPRAFPPPPPPRPLADNWDDYAPGDKPEGLFLSVYEDDAAQTMTPAPIVRVTDETAYSGKNSLKFTDAANQKNVWTPHIVYRPAFNQGRMVGTFALRHETGAVFTNEWRDGANPNRVGPSLRVNETGQVLANNKPLGITLAPSVWAKFETVCVLGSGYYDLTITPQNAAPHSFTHLPCGSGAAFETVRWWGFVADGNALGVFFLDEVSLREVPPPKK